MGKSIQESIIETIQAIAGERLKNVDFTKSYTGIVHEINGLECKVEIFDSTYDCIIPHNLKSFVQERDIVIVQDVFNNNSKRIVQGTISSLNKSIFHIYDPISDTIVSSVLQLWDENNGVPIDVVLEIE